MSDVLPDENRIAAEIERLKAKFPKTRELYREVCALLFFRFGITPTANRLYQLVKRGSMSTPTQVLGEFWTELRKKSRVRIEHPDLPADLQAAAGELVATLWTRSTASAQAVLETLRTETEAEKVAARDAVVSLQAELGRTETALEQRTSALLAAQVRIRDLEQAQAAGEATRQALETEIGRQQDEIGARDRALVQARGDFSGELDKLRSSAELAEERLRAAEKRALLEIERERGMTARSQKELEAAARRAEQGETPAPAGNPGAADSGWRRASSRRRRGGKSGSASQLECGIRQGTRRAEIATRDHRREPCGDEEAPTIIRRDQQASPRYT